MKVQSEYQQLALDLALDQLANGRELRLRVVSDSMAPLILPGDFITLEPVAGHQLRRGDLVILLRDEEWITHRLVARTQTGWLTKGDNRRRLDAPVAEGQLIGLVKAIERQGRIRDMTSRYWRFANRFLGWLSWVEACVFQWGRQARAAQVLGEDLEGAGQAAVGTEGRILGTAGRLVGRCFFGFRRIMDGSG